MKVSLRVLTLIGARTCDVIAANVMVDPVAEEIDGFVRSPCSNAPATGPGRPRIRIITLRVANSHHLRTTGSARSFYARWDAAHARWAWRNHYSMHVHETLDPPHSVSRKALNWRKPLLLGRALADPNIDYVMWLDADIVVTNASVQLEDFLDAARHRHVIAGLTMSEHDCLSDGCVPRAESNTGALLVRNTCVARRLLSEWWHAGDGEPGLDIAGTTTDQLAFNQVLLRWLEGACSHRREPLEGRDHCTRFWRPLQEPEYYACFRAAFDRSAHCKARCPFLVGNDLASGPAQWRPGSFAFHAYGTRGRAPAALLPHLVHLEHSLGLTQGLPAVPWGDRT